MCSKMAAGPADPSGTASSDGKLLKSWKIYEIPEPIHFVYFQLLVYTYEQQMLLEGHSRHFQLWKPALPDR